MKNLILAVIISACLSQGGFDLNFNPLEYSETFEISSQLWQVIDEDVFENPDNAWPESLGADFPETLEVEDEN